MPYTKKEIELKKTASAVAAALSERILNDRDLVAAFKKAASPETTGELTKLNGKILMGALEAASEDDKEKKKAFKAEFYNALIGKAEVLASVLAADASVEKSFVTFFEDIKKSPKFAQVDIAKAYEDIGAATLARAVKTAKP